MSTQIGLNLAKGEKMDVTKGNPGLTQVSLGLGWDTSDTATDYDLDGFAILLDSSNKLTSDSNVVYFNQLKSSDGSVVHSGDNLTGAGDGDDEVINVDLSKVSADINTIGFFVNIFKATERNQRFGQVKNAFIRVFDPTNGNEMGRFDLAEDASSNTGFLMGKLYRNNGEWKFESAGTGVNGSITEISSQFK